jgi:tRNA (guanine-N7-)-methyltransferase
VNVLGVEISQPSLRKAVRKARRSGVDNVRVVYGSAQPVLWALCAPQSVAAVFVNFPDPWPKPAHHHRRLVSESFLDLLASRQTLGARLDIATDDTDYAAVIGELLATSPYYASRHHQAYLHEDVDRAPTKYEQKARREGRQCFFFQWQRTGVDARRRYPVPEEYPMPHVILRHTLILDDLIAEPVVGTYKQTGVAIRYIGVFTSPARDFLLVDTHIEEEPVSQRVALSIRRRGADELILGLHELGYPRKTAGVHYALHCLVQEFQNRSPQTEVIQSNLKLPGT